MPGGGHLGMSVFRRRERPEHPYGTVPYHRDMARSWQRHGWVWLVQAAVMGLCAMTFVIWFLVPLYLAGIFWAGSRWDYTRSRRREHEELAWKVEGEQTVNGLAAAGLLTSPREMLEVLRDGPPPPGTKRKDWIAQHDEMIKALEEQGDA